MQLRTRIRTVVALAMALTMVFASAALADNLQDDVVADGNGTFAAGSSTTVNYSIVPNGEDGCNVDGSNTATMQVNAPAGLSANPTSLTFSSCRTNQAVVYSSNTAGSYNVAPTITGGKALNNGWNVNPAKATLTVTAVTAPSDTAAPTDASISINSGDDWTNNRNVSLALSANDNVGVTKYRLAETQTGLATASDVAVSPAAASFSATSVPFTLSDSDGSKTVWMRVFDAAGNSADASDTIGLDRVKPTITGSTGTYVPGTWTNQNVTVSFSCADNSGGSGIDTADDTVAGTTLSTSGADQQFTNMGSCTDRAGNTADSATVSNIDIDKDKPTITLTTPQANGTYTLNQAINADYSCDDQVALSGVKSCVGTVANGAAIDTSSVGPKTFTVNAEDNAGNLAIPVSVGYNVYYAFGGWQEPVKSLPIRNTVKAGRAVPVKFSLGGDQGLSIFNGNGPKWSSFSCNSAPTDPVDETLTAGSSSLQYDALTDTYTYVWKSDTKWANTCMRLALNLKDGSNHYIDFQFTK